MLDWSSRGSTSLQKEGASSPSVLILKSLLRRYLTDFYDDKV